MSTRVLLVDDHTIMRQGLRTLLEQRPDTQVIAEAADGATAIALADELAPDIVIMDVAMPGMTGIEATTRIRAQHPEINVIALSMHADRHFVVEMFRAGAKGYLLKMCAFEELLTALNAVVAGELYLSPQIASLVLTDYLHHLDAPEPTATARLTPREREVLKLIAAGKTTREISEALYISIKTVETHRQQMMRKLHTRSIAELIKYAIREGMVPLR